MVHLVLGPFLSGSCKKVEIYVYLKSKPKFSISSRIRRIDRLMYSDFANSYYTLRGRPIMPPIRSYSYVPRINFGLLFSEPKYFCDFWKERF